MKKIIATLLLTSICLTLVSCGNANEELEKYKKYDTLINYLEAEDYENAYWELLKISQNGPSDSASDTDSKKTTTVEITLDNWQEYFEYKLVAVEKRNDFDELELVYAQINLCLKEEYADRAVSMEIPTEFACTGGYKCYFKYNTQTGEITEGEPVDGYYVSSENGGTFTLKTHHIEKGYQLIGGVQSETFVVEDGIASIVGTMYSEIEIVRIQGTLTITE